MNALSADNSGPGGIILGRFVDLCHPDGKIEELKKHIHGSIVHNNPPNDDANEPFSSLFASELESALQIVKAQLPSPNDRGSAARNATALIEGKKEKLKTLLDRFGEKFMDSFATESGKQAAQALKFAFIALLAHLTGLTEF